MENKLISSRLFGELLRSEEPGFKNRADYLNWHEKLRNNFDDFLKQPLELWMLIPCKLVDGVWVVLVNNYPEKPETKDYHNEYGGNFELYQHNLMLWREYQEAKDRVLFEGFESRKSIMHGGLIIQNGCLNLEGNDFNQTIEYLTRYEIYLTPTALKQIFG